MTPAILVEDALGFARGEPANAAATVAWHFDQKGKQGKLTKLTQGLEYTGGEALFQHV
jgi:hypothetical protein